MNSITRKLSCPKIALALLIVTAITLGLYAYMLLRPVSHGMRYTAETEYLGETYTSTTVFRADNTSVTTSNSIDIELESFYFVKGGYLFLTYATTEEEYREEVEYIKENFEQAKEIPFYASRVNAFKLVNVAPDGFSTVYKCDTAVVLAILFGVVELMLIALTAISLVLSKRARANDTQDTE